MLQHHLYYEHYPAVSDDKNEFEILVKFLGLGYRSSEILTSYSPSKLFNWCIEDPKVLLQTWCQEYINFVQKSTMASKVYKFLFLFLYLFFFCINYYFVFLV